MARRVNVQEQETLPGTDTELSKACDELLE